VSELVFVNFTLGEEPPPEVFDLREWMLTPTGVVTVFILIFVAVSLVSAGMRRRRSVKDA
jgi:hypothetical protein